MAGQKPRVLVVDDENAILEMVTRKLTACETECTTALDVATAQSLLSRIPFDVIFLDIILPGRSGVEFLIEVRERFPDTAVVMITGVVDTTTAVRAMQQGAFAYLVKPFDLDDLVACIHRVLDRRRQLKVSTTTKLP